MRLSGNLLAVKEMVRVEGIEPYVCWLEARYSAIELNTHGRQGENRTRRKPGLQSGAVTTLLPSGKYGAAGKNRTCVPELAIRDLTIKRRQQKATLDNLGWKWCALRELHPHLYG